MNCSVLLWSVLYFFSPYLSKEYFFFSWNLEALPFPGLEPRDTSIPGLGVKERREGKSSAYTARGLQCTEMSPGRGWREHFLHCVCIGITYLFTVQNPEVLLTTQVTSCLLLQFLAPTSSGIFFLFILVHQMGLWKNPWFSFVLFSLFCFHAVFSLLEMTWMGNGLL